MGKEVLKIQEERQKLIESLQKEYDMCETYQEKLINIYKVLLKSQYYYLQYKNNNKFDENYLEALVQKLNEAEDLDDKRFSEFLFNNITRHHFRH